MAWHREDTKPLPESVVIQANGAYMSLSDWLSWLLHVLGRYIHTEKNGTVWAHEGYLHPHSWKWAIPTPQVGSGRGTGWPYFVKSPVGILQNMVNPSLAPTRPEESELPTFRYGGESIHRVLKEYRFSPRGYIFPIRRSNQLNQSERFIYAPLAWITSDSGNGLVSSLYQPLPEPILINN